MSTITISLPDNLKRYVEREVASAGYGNVSEYFRSLLREAQANQLREALDAQLLSGLSAMPGEAGDAFWSGLRKHARALLKDAATEGMPAWPAALAPHREALESLFRESAVQEFALLGASARELEAAPEAPLQCAVHLGNLGGDELAQSYGQFSSALAEVLKRPIELIEIGSMGATRLRRLIEQTRRVLYLAASGD